jgi:hypothetical protein
MRHRTYKQACAEHYDEAFEVDLLVALSRCIAETSRVSDANAVCLRTGETCSALLTCIAGVLALSPAVAGSPAILHRAIERFQRELHQRLGAALTDAEVGRFRRHVFSAGDVAGHA